MARTRRERNAYSRGYNAGMWPEWRPPSPPRGIMRDMVEATTKLCDAVDGELAKFCEDDPIEEVLCPPLEEARKVLVRMTKWLTGEEPAEDRGPAHRTRAGGQALGPEEEGKGMTLPRGCSLCETDPIDLTSSLGSYEEVPCCPICDQPLDVGMILLYEVVVYRAHGFLGLCHESCAEEALNA